MKIARSASRCARVLAFALAAAPGVAFAAPVTTRFLQAEGATFNGACTFDTNYTGFTGTSFVNCPNDTSSFIKWTGVRVQSAGTKRLSFRFANGTTANRAAELQVNGVVVNGNLAFNPTGAWSTWAVVTVDVALNAGDNTVQLRGTVASAGLANMDRLDVAEISETVPDWGIAMTESTMLRSPTPASLGGWGYANALRLHGMYRTWQRVGDPRYLNYIKAWVDGVVGTQGNLYTDGTHAKGVTLGALDNFMPGALIMDIYDNFPQANYRIALQTIRNRFTDASNTSGGTPTWSTAYPRTGDGGLFHSTNLIGQLWLDGVFMGQTFLHRYGQKFGGADKTYADNEGTQQLIIQFNHQKDNVTGLFFHAYDEQGDVPWIAPGTNHSQEFWCRAMGWQGITMVEELGVLDPNHVNRPQIISILQGLVAAWASFQDPVSGRWFQVVNKGSNPNNWTETSCSSMYSYVISRAVKGGFVDPSFATAAANGYAGVLQKISFGTDATLAADLTNIIDISEGTDVGDEAYYEARQRPVNDNHGLGAFLIMYEHFAATLAAPGALDAADGTGQAALTWTDGSSNETGFKIERKPLGAPDTSFVEVAQVGAGVLSYNDAVAPGSYTYRVRAFNDLTYSAYSNSDDATVSVAQGPAAPSGLAVTVTGGSSVVLTWVDNSSNETGFRVERKVAPGSYSTLVTKAANVTTHTDTVLATGTYGYRVIATGAPDSAPSNEVLVVIGNPTADAYVRSGTPTTNYGTAATIDVKSTNTAGTKRNGFLLFPLAGVGANVTSAKLRLYGNAATTAKATSIYSVADIGWSETAIVWDYPSVGAGGPAMGGTALATQTVGTGPGWVEWDVTTYVQQQRALNAGALTLGVKSGVLSDDGQTTFNSREGANKPILVITSGP